MNDVYVAHIDSLNILNAQLQQENQNLSTNLSKEMSKNENLSAENSRLFSKVSAGSVLKTMNVVTEGLRYRSNGKEVVTSKARQVQKIRTHFTLAENQVVDNGPLDIYIRVLGPDGAVMSAEKEVSFKVNGQDLAYTMKETVQYHNSDTPIEIMWAKGSEFVKGKYNVQIYQSGNLIGKSVIELK